MGQIFDVNKAISEQLYASLSTQMAAKPTAYYNVPLGLITFLPNNTITVMPYLKNNQSQ